ncbi:MAG: nucleotide 5'-monophosphate nucleosidase PpnN [Pseudomonadota bacterium]|nr:nucleotide 5'-monophosphate nucleosidase PpnN [Pseudomonadota bacterium]
MERITATLEPQGYLALLAPHEVQALLSGLTAPQHELLRRCALAILHYGDHTDNAMQILREFDDFDVELIVRDQGAGLRLINAPASAFVDGEVIGGIGEHLFAVLRDLLYVSNVMQAPRHAALDTPQATTTAVFQLLRNAGVVDPAKDPHLVVCWGGHAIPRHEYDYTKEVGHQLGLRDLNVCTGCGPGAMKGPMKGATIGRAKQRTGPGRYLGITEPGIVAAEPPNPIVNELVIMPDIEKRLEAFVRLAQAIIIFPGGVGTTEELLYLLGLLLHPDNQDIRIPLLLTGPEGSEAYFEAVDRFVRETLGDAAATRFEVVIGDAATVARRIKMQVQETVVDRRERRQPLHFNWQLTIDAPYQEPFVVTHDSMAALQLFAHQPAYERGANLRRAFSGIVTGNVKPDGIAAIEALGPYEIAGDSRLLTAIDQLLSLFVAQGRMKINGSDYRPCYRLAA